MSGGSDYRALVTRCPAKLEPKLMGEPKAVHGMPRSREGEEGLGRRKPIPVGMGADDEGRRGRVVRGAEVRQRLNGLALSPP